MKKYKTGLVIGKFYPFHKGHQYLIQEAQNNCDKVYVIVCHTEKYKIPVKTRSSWIKSTFPDAIVKILVHDTKLDSDSPEISDVWAKLTVKFLGFVPDAVFSSENYGSPYAEHMGSKHHLVDLKRLRVPISATKIRSDVFKHWDFLPEVVKPYFAKRIAVVGAESTGTTTLSKSLASHYKTSWVPEYGRTYYEGKMTSSNLNQWHTSEFVHIAKIQNQMENELAKYSNKILICDTNSFATEIWHDRYVGYMANQLRKISNLAPADLYIVTNTDIPFVQDGTRDGEHIRQRMHEKFISELTRRKKDFIVVSGDRDTRLSTSIKAIDLLFHK